MIDTDTDLYAAGVVPASGRVLVDLGEPTLGGWYVRRVNVGGGGSLAAVAGSAYILSGLLPVVGADPPGTYVRDQTTALPNVSTWHRGELPVGRGEHLYVIVTGGTVGQQIVATAKVEGFR